MIISTRMRVAAPICAITTVGILAACLCAGSTNMPIERVVSVICEWASHKPYTNPAHAAILLNIRLPRVLLAFLVGGALAISGVCMQGLFQNPMADPHILGVSSGAALGATMAIAMGLGALPMASSAFVGGILSVTCVALLSQIGRRTGPLTLLLAGIAVSSCLTAVISLIMTLNRNKLDQIVLWTMGSFTAANYSKVALMAAVSLPACALLLCFSRAMNIMLLGDEQAASLGINVGRVRMIVLTLCTLVTAVAVSQTGIIGFVGLMVPHALRLICGPDHRRLMPLSILIGGAYLAGMDALARTIAAPIELPVGVLTAIVGGPFFLFLLFTRRNTI